LGIRLLGREGIGADHGRGNRDERQRGDQEASAAVERLERLGQLCDALEIDRSLLDRRVGEFLLRSPSSPALGP
jgi:hypothetical protein